MYQKYKIIVICNYDVCHAIFLFPFKIMKKNISRNVILGKKKRSAYHETMTSITVIEKSENC